MGCYWLFNESELPRPLTDNEFLLYMKLARKGDLDARNKVISHNIGLVLSCVLRKYKDAPYEKKELVEVGIFGLISAVDTYDIERGTVFSTYAYRCIDNEIMYFMRRNNRYLGDIRFEEQISSVYDLTYGDTLEDRNGDLEVNFIKGELIEELREQLALLPEKKRELINMFYGLSGDRQYSQQEIADMLGIKKQGVSIAIKRTLSKMKKNLML